MDAVSPQRPETSLNPIQMSAPVPVPTVAAGGCGPFDPTPGVIERYAMAEFTRVAALFALTRRHVVGAAAALIGMAIVALQPDASN